jgi:outer membrane protein OmpU
MKKALLATTALAGASLLATSAVAGTPTVGDNLEVSISGTVRFSIAHGSADTDNGRGYSFTTDESEVAFNAKATSDSGIDYGLSIEIQTQPDDTANTDEAWVFLAGDFGRVELGDQDGASGRAFVRGANVMAGRGGFDGPTGRHFDFGGAAKRKSPGTNVTSDDPKAIYFTPRIAGFQAGVSWTPDTGATGGKIGAGNGDFENVVSVGANYSQTFGDVTVTVAGMAEFGDAEDEAVNEDAEIWGIGAKVDIAGFSVGGGYVDFNDTGITKADAVGGADAGSWWDIAASYKTGPWKASIGAFFGTNDNAAGLGESEVDIYSIGVTYNFAPGLDIKGDINFIDVDNAGTAMDNEGQTAVLSVQASF